MSNEPLSTNLQIQQYLKRKESNLRSKYFKKYMFLNKELSLVMLFQSEAMKYIRNKYGISNTDFKVLLACRMHRLIHNTGVKPYYLRRYLKGVWMEQIYKSIRILEKKGFIEPSRANGHKIYYISHNGESCLKSYAKVFDEVYYKHIQGLE